MSRSISRRGRPKSVIPKYRHHKASGQAVVTVDGRDIYLGSYGSAESRGQYGVILAKIARQEPVVEAQPEVPLSLLTVDEVLVGYYDHCQTHYVKHGQQTSEVPLVAMTIKPLHEKYGDVPAAQFGPRLLKLFREDLVGLGWCRNTVNQAIGRVRRIFKWAVAEEMIGPEVLQKLQAVDALRAGRTVAPDRPKRTALSSDRIEPIRQRVRPLVRDLIDLQLATGARSGELLSLTAAMIDRAGSVWVATLQRHKSDSSGQNRKLYFSPRAQQVLAGYLSADRESLLFRMRRDAYCRAIVRACEELKIDRWTPHHLRHTFLTRIREEYGIEAAQVLAGHTAPDMTAVYSVKMDSLAATVAAQLA